MAEINGIGIGELGFENYVPTDRQMLAHTDPSMFKLYGGAMGGGKTVWLCAEAIQLSMDFVGNVGYLCRHSFKDFKKTTLVVLMEMIPSKIVKSYNKTDGLITFKNGSRIMFGDLEKTDKIKSMNLGWYGIDEASDTTEESFLMLNTRLRKNIKGIVYYGLLTSNPEPGWLKDRFVDPQNAGIRLKDHSYICSLPSDNPHLPASYLESFDHMPLIWRTKYRDGSWDVFDNQIFKPDWLLPSEKDPDIAAKYTAIDPAIGENDENDETVITTFGIDYHGICHELETVSGRWSFDAIVSNCIAVNKRHSPELFGVEYVAFQKALGDVLIRENIPVYKLKADKDKVRRAISMTDWFEQGKIKINNQDTVKQLLEFPKGKHDDRVDAVVYCTRMIRKLSKDTYEKKDIKYADIDEVSKNFWLEHNKEKDENNSYQKEFDRFFIN